MPVDRMVEDFKEEAQKHLEYNVETNIEWECIAQHYGIPTRLLDWTTNAINALYFAVENRPIKAKRIKREEFERSEGIYGGGGAVFVIDPLEINKLTVLVKDFEKSPKVLDAYSDADILDKCLHEEVLPVCFSGLNREKRISRQSGKFSTTGRLVWPMDYYTILREKIIKILIPYSAHESIRRQLHALGITRENIYVEDDKKDEIARAIATETKNRFLKSIKG